MPQIQPEFIPAPPRSAILRAGSVPYLNAAPLVYGLEERLSLLPPSSLAVELRRGGLDAALLSITEVLLNDAYDVLEGPCVASLGEVYSVFLAHRRPLAEIRVVSCDPASLTSVNLLRILLAERHFHPEFVPLLNRDDTPIPDALLLIGNPAIAFRRAQETHEIWDLGAAWHELTGLPFVYAVWALRREADTLSLRSELLAAAERGHSELETIIRESPEFDEAFRRTYLTRHIHYRMGAAEKRGITTFAMFLRKHLSGPVFDVRYVT